MTASINEIAIIGAGLGGAALALCLSSSFPDCKITIFESRSASAPLTISSGVILTPNGLAVLDKLGILPLIKDRCYIATYRCFKDRYDNTTKKTPLIAEEQNGYFNHRLWRTILLDTMLMVLKERENVSVLYEQRLVKIHTSSSTPPGANFDIEDLQLKDQKSITTHHTDLLIGTDGLYSTVRQNLHPSYRPSYTGTTAVITHIPRESVTWPTPDYELNATIQDIPSAIVFLPEDPSARIIMVGRQFTHLPASIISSRSASEALQNDKQKLLDLFCERYEEFGSTSRKILDSVKKHPEDIFMWPFMKVTIPSWYRDDGRVLLLGDAAHAIPASSGQGVNQVLEDVWMLTLLLKHRQESDKARVPQLTSKELLGRLHFWQETRQSRIARICDWADNVQNVGRLGKAEREALESERGKRSGAAESDSMAWLYDPCIEEEVRRWFEGRGESVVVV